MKKILLFILMLASSIMFAQDNIETSISLNNKQKLKNVPTAVKNYILENYPNDSIIKAGYRKNLWIKTYEVHLQKWVIEFDDQGNWTKNYTLTGTATLDYLPKEIQQIITKNYPKQKIIKLEQKKDNLFVYLDDNKNLSFKNTNK